MGQIRLTCKQLPMLLLTMQGESINGSDHVKKRALKRGSLLSYRQHRFLPYHRFTWAFKLLTCLTSQVNAPALLMWSPRDLHMTAATARQILRLLRAPSNFSIKNSRKCDWSFKFQMNYYRLLCVMWQNAASGEMTTVYVDAMSSKDINEVKLCAN